MPRSVSRVNLVQGNFAGSRDEIGATTRTLCGWVSLLYGDHEHEMHVWQIVGRNFTKMTGVDPDLFGDIDEGIEATGLSRLDVCNLYHLSMDELNGVSDVHQERRRCEHSLQNDTGRGSDCDVFSCAASLRERGVAPNESEGG